MRILVDTPDALVRMVEATRACPRVALDVESDGLFAYRAGLCVVQLATTEDVYLVDTLTLSRSGQNDAALAPLVPLLGAEGPVKVLHDLGFDARLLGEHGVPLARCHDTSIAAQLLGRKATGLGTLLGAELGVVVDKSLQTHDWRTRPLASAHLDYLAADVEHLMTLDDRLRAEAEARGVLAEVDEETDYRLLTAGESVRDPDMRPPYVRVKGIDKLAFPRRRDLELAVARELAELREGEARARNVPPYRVMGNEAILALAAARPSTSAELARVRGLGSEAGRSGSAILRAILQGKRAGKIPADEERWFERPRVPAEEARAERARQARLSTWRKTEAEARGVDEQAVLPGHLVRAIAATDPLTDVGALAAVRGMSARRLERYGEAIVAALTTPLPTAAPEAPGTEGSSDLDDHARGG